MKKRALGFTIIEVVLVLAIAGLIFLMVFIALPTLQRNQRDTQRRNIMDRVAAQTQSYMGNNNGNIPMPSTDATWATFRTNYMQVGTDDFVDPDGRPFVFKVQVTGTTTDFSTNPTRDADNGANVPIFVYPQGRCDGEVAVSAGTGATRRVAFRVKLEGAGTYCVDNA
jgi:type II secretory pathway pseudopilin PulG